MLVVENVSHGFGARTILENVSFRLRKGEHIALVGANGEGKSTFLNIITKKLMPDAGNIKWSSRVTVGYLDQHTVLTKGMTIRDVLKSAYTYLFELEEKMNDICDRMGDVDEAEMNRLLEELGEIQELLDSHDFYMIDSKVEEVGRALGLADIQNGQQLLNVGNLLICDKNVGVVKNSFHLFCICYHIRCDIATVKLHTIYNI